MQNQYDPRTTDASGFGPAVSVGVPRAARDAGLRSYMLKVYNYMASGVLLTGIVALLFAPYARDVLINANGTGLSGLGWLITFAPLGFVFAMSFGINRMQTATLQMLFWAFAAVMGLSMSTVFIVYTGVSIAQTFFAVTAAFLGLSLWGYTTQRDLSGMGSFLIMGLFGVIIASLVNLFLASSALQFIVSIVGVLVFAGLTAWDTQRLKNEYVYGALEGETAERSAIMGALSLYLNFINLFTLLLQLLGQREE